MSATGLDVFDRTLHKTNAWLSDLMEALGRQDRHAAYLALRTTLHALRDRLTVEEVAQLGAQLPMLVRGFYYEGWDPTGTPLRVRHKEEFLARIQEEFRSDEPIDPERREAIPGTRRCATCKEQAETGALAEDEPDYCPHCGALVEVRVSRGGGITRYKRFCTGEPPCRL